MGGLCGEGRYRHLLAPGMSGTGEDDAAEAGVALWKAVWWQVGGFGKLGLSWVPLPLVGPLGGSSFSELEMRPLYQPSQQMQHP